MDAYLPTMSTTQCQEEVCSLLQDVRKGVSQAKVPEGVSRAAVICRKPRLVVKPPPLIGKPRYL